VKALPERIATTHKVELHQRRMPGYVVPPATRWLQCVQARGLCLASHGHRAEHSGTYKWPSQASLEAPSKVSFQCCAGRASWLIASCRLCYELEPRLIEVNSLHHRNTRRTTERPRAICHCPILIVLAEPGAAAACLAGAEKNLWRGVGCSLVPPPLSLPRPVICEHHSHDRSPVTRCLSHTSLEAPLAPSCPLECGLAAVRRHQCTHYLLPQELS
jgi:hypothetical protein